MKNDKTKPQNSIRSTVLLAVVLAGIGIASRLLLADWPNFNPAMAIAIFMGYAIQDRRIGIAAILLMMGVSDWAIGFYDWPLMPLMLFVYCGFVFAWTTGFLFRGMIDSPRHAVKFSGIAAPAIIASVVFFLITNAACCAIGWYPMTWTGLTTSLAAGLPFLRPTIVGNLFFSVLIFSGYFAATEYLQRPATATEKQQRVNKVS